MWELKSKYWFKGTLEMKTALHIGGGQENFRNTDSPVVRTPDGYPFIPGSSFKGTFRSTVEKLAVSIPGLTSCQLVENSNACPTVRPKAFAKQKEKMKEDELVNYLEKHLCSTCKLFGSPYSASKIIFQDLKLKNPPGITQIRDGVVIDRDSECAMDQLKYDFEVVPPATEFDMEIEMENPSAVDMGLACIGINEFLSEMAYLGGIKSRGLGNCKITDMEIYKLDLESDGKEERLRKYLLNTKIEDKTDKETDPVQFIQDRIDTLFENAKSN